MYQAKGKGKDYEKQKNASPFLKGGSCYVSNYRQAGSKESQVTDCHFSRKSGNGKFSVKLPPFTNIYFETFPIYRKVKEQYYEPPHALHLH